jgi:hypothetical protein
MKPNGVPMSGEDVRDSLDLADAFEDDEEEFSFSEDDDQLSDDEAAAATAAAGATAAAATAAAAAAASGGASRGINNALISGEVSSQTALLQIEVGCMCCRG